MELSWASYSSFLAHWSHTTRACSSSKFPIERSAIATKTLHRNYTVTDAARLHLALTWLVLWDSSPLISSTSSLCCLRFFSNSGLRKSYQTLWFPMAGAKSFGQQFSHSYYCSQCQFHARSMLWDSLHYLACFAPFTWVSQYSLSSIVTKSSYPTQANTSRTLICSL